MDLQARSVVLETFEAPLTKQLLDLLTPQRVTAALLHCRPVVPQQVNQCVQVVNYLPCHHTVPKNPSDLKIIDQNM